MRQDQFESLQQRAEQLVDLFLAESDPAKWPGAGIEPANMEKGTRGDRYWCKKDAVATLACAQRIITLVDTVRAKTAGGEVTPGAVTEDEGDLEVEMQAAEAEASRTIERHRKAAKLNGKP
ncbi:hypothetical protein [Hydrogenophaga sp.]|uniref:hypothetical protein n=1 Tax=Hydrogenophaga sp. TaxID=1904254 RepID=UPI003F70CF92